MYGKCTECSAFVRTVGGLCSALDYKTSKEILKLIETVNEKYGNTIIMVTHNDAIKDMATRVVRLKDGMIRSNVLNEKRLHAEDLEW